MKYIRTKVYDLILRVSDKITDEYGTYYLYDNSAKWFEDQIAKVADTIEELCDCFVDYCEEYDSHLVSNEKSVKRKNYEVYGAIWTSKGLIYVAKMNDKGELELL